MKQTLLLFAIFLTKFASAQKIVTLQADSVIVSPIQVDENQIWDLNNYTITWELPTNERVIIKDSTNILFRNGNFYPNRQIGFNFCKDCSVQWQNSNIGNKGFLNCGTMFPLFNL